MITWVKEMITWKVKVECSANCKFAKNGRCQMSVIQISEKSECGSYFPKSPVDLHESNLTRK